MKVIIFVVLKILEIIGLWLIGTIFIILVWFVFHIDMIEVFDYIKTKWWLGIPIILFSLYGWCEMFKTNWKWAERIKKKIRIWKIKRS